MTGLTTRRGWGSALGRLALGAVLAVGLAHGPAGAATPPEAFVEAFAARVLATLRDGSLAPAQRIAAVDELVTRSFALDRVARIALGRYWRVATPAEQREFSQLFKASVLASYGKRFDAYADRRLRVAGAQPAGEHVSVESYVEGGATPIRLDWRLAEIDGDWRILDVSVEGVSLLVTYRNEFAAVIERGGGQVSALLAELRQRAGAVRTAAATS